METGVLFDLDGVLIDSESRYTEFWDEVEKTYPTGIPDFAIRIKGNTLPKILGNYFPQPERQAYIHRMLKEFRSQRYHMAIVIDEFGGVSGLVTIEDILELIVGEIEDEYDEEDDIDFRQLSRHTWTVRALASIEDFNEAFGTHFSDEEVDTIGGLVMQAFGHLPARGETIDIDGYQFKVAMADSRRIIQVHVKIPDDSPQPKLDE